MILRSTARRSGSRRGLRIAAAAGAIWVVAILGWPGNVAAQYSSIAGETRTDAPKKETLEERIAESRWQAGPFRVQPWIGLRDVSFVSSQGSVDGSPRSDQWTVTAGAGLRLYAPIGGKTIFAAHALPEYVWWQDDTSKEGVAGRYGAGIFGYGNRLDFHLSHQFRREQDFFSTEIQELTQQQRATTATGVEIRVLRSLHVFVEAGRSEVEGNKDDANTFRLLDRDEDSVGAGFRLRSHRGWQVSFGVRDGGADFAPGARDFSYDFESLTFGLEFTSGRFGGLFELEDTDAEPKEGSILRPFSEILGFASLTLRPTDRASIEVFAERRSTFSIFDDSSLILAEEQGVRLETKLGKVDLQLFASTGNNDYEGFGADAGRDEDFDALGATVGVPIGRWGTLALNVLQRSYDGSGQRAGTDVTTYGISIQLGELADRLSIGDGDSAW